MLDAYRPVPATSDDGPPLLRGVPPVAEGARGGGSRSLVPGPAADMTSSGRLSGDRVASAQEPAMSRPVCRTATAAMPRASLDLRPSERDGTCPVRALLLGRFTPRHPTAWSAP